MINGSTYNFAGTASSVVSVGAPGAERQLVNVAPGAINATSTDAINGSQLYATNQAIEDVAVTANKGWNVTTTASGTGVVNGSTTTNVAPGDTVTYTAGDNVVLTQNGKQITLAVSANPNFTSVTTGNTTIDTNGLTIIGGPSVTNVGINAGGTTITNVAAGTNPTDAVNVNNMVLTQTGSNVAFAVSDNPNFTSVTVGGTTITGNGVSGVH